MAQAERRRRRADVLARFGDQALVSVGNFLLALLMARLLGPAQFGHFALLWTLIVLALSVHWALVSSPMQNTLAAKAAEERPALFAALGLHALLLAAASAALAPLVLWGASASTLTAGSLGVAAFACAAVVAQEFARRWLLATERPAAALTSDALRHGGALVLLSAGGAAGLLMLDSSLALLAACALAALVPLASDFRALQHRPGLARTLAREHAASGRWLLPSVLLQSVVAGAPLYAANAAGGSAAAGGYRAVVNLMTPVVSLTEALETFLPLRAAAAFGSEGRPGLGRVIRRWGLPLGLGCALFVGSVWALGARLLALAFGPAYAGFAAAMPALALAMLLQFATYLFNVRLRASGRTRAIFVADLASAAALLLVLALVPIDPFGSVVAAALATAQAVKLALLVWSDARTLPAPPP